MMLKDVEIGYGTLRFLPKLEATPETVTVEGNTTFHNGGSVGRDAHFMVSFMISGKVAATDDIAEYNVFTLTVPVVDHGAERSFSDIESVAAVQLAPLLRQFAEELERTTNKKAADNP